jgi:hypothetical protein
MKNTKLIILSTLLCLFAMCGRASLISTNSVLGQAFNGAKGILSSTNLAVYAIGGHSLNKNFYLAGAGVSYNITPIVAPIFGVDERWNKNLHTFSSIQGGLTLELPVEPLASVGITNFSVEPLVGVLAANGNGGSVLGSITIAGVNANLVDFGAWSIFLGLEYENCQGQGVYNANYLAGYMAASRNASFLGEPLVMREEHDKYICLQRANHIEDGFAKVASWTGIVKYRDE